MFVVTQLPLSSTIDDYLRLICDQKVSVIVNLEEFKSLVDNVSDSILAHYLVPLYVLLQHRKTTTGALHQLHCSIYDMLKIGPG